MSGAYCSRFPDCSRFSDAPRAPSCDRHDCPGAPQIHKLLSPAEKPDDVVGWKTIDTGERDPLTGFPVTRREPMTRAEGDALWASVQAAKAQRAEQMPDEHAAINALFEAHARLKELGWKEPQYCPKNGKRFKVIELGSTGIFDCYYQGEWPRGLYMVSDDRDIYPTSSGVAMFKLLPEDQAIEDARWKEAGKRLRKMLDEDSSPTSASSDSGRGTK